MTVLGESSVAYIIVGAAVPLLGFLGRWHQSTRIKNEVTSPNGMKSGDALYESRKMLIDVRTQLSEVREAQLAGWERAHHDTETALEDRIRLESKVDQIAAAQEDHLARDDTRFARLYEHLDIDDPFAP